MIRVFEDEDATEEKTGYYRIVSRKTRNSIELVDGFGNHIQWIATINEDGSLTLCRLMSAETKGYDINVDEHGKIVVT